MNSIPKRVSQAILNSLSGGVVPRIGLEFIAVGRKREVEAALGDLENISSGAAAFRFIVGRYGSGKTFFLQAIRNYALVRGFVAADVDLSPEKRLNGEAGLETYREMMQRLSTKVRPEGGALESLLQKWINSVRLRLADKTGASPTDAALDSKVEWEIYDTISQMEGLAHGFDFATVAAAYYKAFVRGDDETRRAALKWFRGEFATKTEARLYFKVGEIITGDNWYDYVRLLAGFCARIGCKGLLLFVDECVNL
jgi:hypothetical protein